MRFLGVASGPSPRAAAVAGGASGSVEWPLRSSSTPRPRTIQTHTSGKRSRRQLGPQQDSAAARDLPPQSRDEEPLGTLMPSTGLGRARLPPGSYRDEAKEEKEEEEDLNDDACFACQERGQLLCCEGCPRSYHLYCLKPPLHTVPKHSWKCGDCSNPLAVGLEDKDDDGGAYARARRAFTSQCKDVALDTHANKWRARRWDGTQGNRVDVGWYDTEEDAERAYHAYVKNSAFPGRTRKVPASPFRGVSWRNRGKVWLAKIDRNGKRTHLGQFRTQREAALAYNAEVERTGRPVSWLNNVSHAGSAGPGDDGDDYTNATAGGKKAVVATLAKLPRRRLTSMGARGASEYPNFATAGGSDAPNLTLYELEREGNITRNKARMFALGIAGLARQAGTAPEHRSSPSPIMLHPALAAARAPTCKSATMEGAGGEEEVRRKVGPGLAALEKTAIEQRIEALEAALAEAKAVLAEKHLFAHDAAAHR